MKIFKIKHISKTEKINRSKQQLKDFIALDNKDLLDNFDTLYRPAIKRMYDVVIKCEHPENFSGFERLKSDYLLSDIYILTFTQKQDFTLYYRSLKEAKKLPYPKGDYEILEERNGKYQNPYTKVIHYSKRIAVDYALKAIAEFWLDQIPEILNFL